MKRQQQYPTSAPDFPPAYNQHSSAPSAPLLQQYPASYASTSGHSEPSQQQQTMAAVMLEQQKQLAQKELAKISMNGADVEMVLVVDTSSSMKPLYESGQVDLLVGKVLGLTANLDDDGKLPVFAFGATTNADPIIVSFDEPEQLGTRILEQSGGYQNDTNYASAMMAVRKHFTGNFGECTQVHARGKAIFCIVVTDGACNDKFKNLTRQQLSWSSREPIFWKFIGLRGGQDESTFDFLEELDKFPVIGQRKKPSDMGYSVPPRLLDQCDSVVVDKPQDLTMKDMLKEFRPWLVKVCKLGDAHDHKHEQIPYRMVTQDPVANPNELLKYGQEGQEIRNNCCAIL